MRLGGVSAMLAASALWVMATVARPAASASQRAAASVAAAPAADDSSRPSQSSERGSEGTARVGTDRPGLANVTETATPGSLISEQTLQVSLPASHVDVAAPLLLLRYGLLPWLELRTQAPSAVIRFPEGAPTEVLVDDWRFGVAAAASLSSSLSASLVPMIAIPLGSRAVGATGVDGSLQANLSWSAAPNLAFAFAAQGGWLHLERLDGNRRAHFQGMGGALVDLRLVPELMLFTQAQAQYVHSQTVEPSIGGGAAWWVEPWLQLHAEANTGVTEGSPPAALAFGAGVRWW